MIIYPGDVRDLMDVLAEQTLEKVFLLYPDPWPKKRHHKRRFVSKEFLDPLVPLIKTGGKIFLATDIGDYVRQTLLSFEHYDNIFWRAEGPENWRSPWGNWVATRYERKAIAAGRRPYYLTFEKF
jgi:tRNA (guanine-N7-)-methyltransferase